MKEKTSLKDEIRGKILAEITMGQFSTDNVLTEKKLIEMYNVSKSPIREALVELCNEGVLESMPRYGYRIVQLDAKNITDAIEVRLLLEMSAFEQTAPKLSDEQIDILKKHNEEHDRNRISADVWTHWTNNNKFHLLLIGFAGNRLKYQMLEKTLGILSRAYAQYYWNRWKTPINSMDIDSHSSILDRLIRKDFDGAAERLRADILFMREELGIKSQL